MKKHLFSFILLSAILMSQAFAQAPDTIWTYKYNGPSNYDDNANYCAIDNTGHLYVTGSTLVSGSGNNYITIKIDAATGDTIWIRTYNGPANDHDYANCCTVDTFGYLYVTGTSSNGANTDYLTIKYDGNTGDTIWTRRYNGSADGTDKAYGCAVDNNNLYVTGVSFGSGNFFTIKYNTTTGDTIWTHRYGPGSGSDYANACAVDSLGNLYVTGYIDNGVNRDFCTIKYNSSTGDTLWIKKYNGPANGNDYAHGCAVDGSGNLFVTGSVYNGTNNDYLIIRYNPTNGDTVWTRSYNGAANQNDVARGCKVDQYGNLFITGASNNGSNSDILTIKYNPLNGDTIWTCRYNIPSNAHQGAMSCDIDQAGNLYVVGYNDNGTNDDILAIKYNTATGVTGKPELPSTNHKICLEQNYPNPIKKYTNISYQLPIAGYSSLVVYNIAGQKINTLVNERQDAGVYNINWNGRDESGNHASAGIYFYQLKIGDNIITRKMTLIR